jgi:hypothetical protein
VVNISCQPRTTEHNNGRAQSETAMSCGHKVGQFLIVSSENNLSAICYLIKTFIDALIIVSDKLTVP